MTIIVINASKVESDLNRDTQSHSEKQKIKGNVERVFIKFYITFMQSNIIGFRLSTFEEKVKDMCNNILSCSNTIHIYMNNGKNEYFPHDKNLVRFNVDKYEV